MDDNKIFIRDKRRRHLSVCREAADIQELMGDLPGEMCEHKLVSFCRISSAAFLRWVADRAVIYRLSLSTFRVGPRALKLLSGLYGQGRLNKARFVVGRLASSAGANPASGSTSTAWRPSAGVMDGSFAASTTTARSPCSTRTGGASSWKAVPT